METTVYFKDKEERDKAISDNSKLRIKEIVTDKTGTYVIFTDEPWKAKWTLDRLIQVLKSRAIISDNDLNSR